MSPAEKVQAAIVLVYFAALIVVLLIDPKGLADAKALRNAPPPDPATQVHINHVPGKDTIS
jgi:hypothetical protein